MVNKDFKISLTLFTGFSLILLSLLIFNQDTISHFILLSAIIITSMAAVIDLYNTPKKIRITTWISILLVAVYIFFIITKGINNLELKDILVPLSCLGLSVMNKF